MDEIKKTKRMPKSTELEGILKVFATRQAQNKFIKMLGYLPNPDNILKTIGKEVDIYKDLLADPHIAACVQSRKSGVKSLLWTIEKPEEESIESKFIDFIFERLNVSEIINDILDAPSIGYKPLEILWQLHNNYILPVNIVGKPAEWFVYDNNNLLRYITIDNKQGELLPARKFLVARCNPTYENPYGQGFLSKCWWSWTFKKGTTKFWIRFIEKYGTPMLLGKVDRGADDSERDEIFEMLDSAQQDFVGVVPDDTSIEIIDVSKASSPAIFKEFVHFANSEISKAILSQTLTTEQGESGSYAMSQTHLMVRQDVIDADREMVESVFNKLIQWAIDYNFENVKHYPKFVLYKQTDVDKSLADRDATIQPALQASGLKLSKSYWQSKYGFSESDLEEIQTAPTIPNAPFADAETKQASEPEPRTQSLSSVVNIAYNELDEASRKMYAEIQKIIDDSETYDDIKENLIKIYGELDDTEVMNAMQKILIAGRVGGEIEASK